MLLERTRLVRDPVANGVGFPPGAGRPVFLIPGYLAGDVSLAPLARALRRAGYRTKSAGVRLNIGCANAMTAPIEARLERHVARNGGRKVLLIGQSRGGVFARLIAARRPDLVDGLITLGAPILDPLAVHLFVILNVGFVGALGTLGLPGVLSLDCTREGACCEMRHQYELPLPADTPFVSIYSRSDGIVDWRACLEPGARLVEVDSSHCGMAWNVDVFRAIGSELARAVRH
jgi:pimeloyl-ACP methyl ester carboxylesterase